MLPSTDDLCLIATIICESVTVETNLLQNVTTFFLYLKLLVLNAINCRTVETQVVTMKFCKYHEKDVTFQENKCSIEFTLLFYFAKHSFESQVIIT